MIYDIAKIIACLLSWVTKKTTKSFVILKIEKSFLHLLSTLITTKCFYNFNFFHFLDIFFLHTFFLTKNVIPCGEDVSKNYLRHTESLYLFRRKRELMWLDDELGRWISKLFDIYHPNHRRRWRLVNEASIVPTKFITGDEGGRWDSLPRWKQA